MEHAVFRYNVIEVPRADTKARDDAMWEMGRSGWELVNVLQGSETDATDLSKVLLFFKRAAGEDIGV